MEPLLFCRMHTWRCETSSAASSMAFGTCLRPCSASVSSSSLRGRCGSASSRSGPCGWESTCLGERDRPKSVETMTTLRRMTTGLQTCMTMGCHGGLLGSRSLL
eukprot:Rmarinus@m.2618